MSWNSIDPKNETEANEDPRGIEYDVTFQTYILPRHARVPSSAYEYHPEKERYNEVHACGQSQATQEY